MLLEPPPVKLGRVSEAQRFARKHARSGGWGPLLYGKRAMPPVEKLDLGSLCIEDDRALIERAEKEGRL